MIFKIDKSKSNKFQFQIRTFWWKHKGEKKLEAVYLQLFGFVLWVFRNKQTYNDWPCQA